MTTPEHAADWGIETGYVAVRARRLGDAGDEEIRRRVSAGRGRARPAQGRRRRALDPRQSARHQGAQRRLAGGADRRASRPTRREGCAGAKPTASWAISMHAPSEVGAAGCRHCAVQRGSTHIHGWLLLLPAVVLLALFTHYAGGRDRRRQLLLDAAGQRGRGLRRPRQYRHDDRRPDLLAGAGEQPAYAPITVPLSIALALAMALWVNGHITGRGRAAAGVLHADRAADGRGRQHLAVLLHAGLRPAQSDHPRVRLCQHQLARQSRRPRCRR